MKHVAMHQSHAFAYRTLHDMVSFWFSLSQLNENARIRWPHIGNLEKSKSNEYAYRGGRIWQFSQLKERLELKYICLLMDIDALLPAI